MRWHDSTMLLALVPQFEKEATGFVVAGITAAVASFVVNVEPGSGSGTARDKAVFAAWLAAVALAAVVVVRRARRRGAVEAPPLR